MRNQDFQICYDANLRPNANTLHVIEQANTIIKEYELQGFDLTLRQLYYQFVARDFIPNEQREYKKLGEAIGTGRMAGLISWKAITDRTRFLREQSAWSSPANIVRACAKHYQENLWRSQSTRIEVWIEKDALIGVIENVCVKFRVPYFSCRGYVSLSEMWEAAQRIRHSPQHETMILHLGDHDPSGIDMTRDIENRLNIFIKGRKALTMQRIALNMDQILQQEPPPNPAKLSDSRCQKYMAEFGENSWELDALEPAFLNRLIEHEIEEVIDWKLWKEASEQEQEGKDKLAEVAENMG